MPPPRRPLVAAVALAVAAGCGQPLTLARGRIHGTITQDFLHTSMPTARINARPFVWRTTPGFIR